MRKIWGKMTREQARARSERVLARIPFVPAPEPDLAAGETLPGNPENRRAKKGSRTTARARTAEPQKWGGMPEDEFKLFQHRVEIPWMLTRDSMELLGLNRDRYDRLKKNVEARGLLHVVGKVGAKYRLDGPTERGQLLAEELRLPFGNPGKGSVAHECIIFYTERSLNDYFERRQSGTPRMLRDGVSATMGNRQPDLTIISPAGHRIAMQACNQNAPAYEAVVLLELHQLALLDVSEADAVQAIMAVAVNKRHKAAIRKAVRNGNDGAMPPRLVLLDFDSMLEVNWDDVLESVH